MLQHDSFSCNDFGGGGQASARANYVTSGSSSSGHVHALYQFAGANGAPGSAATVTLTNSGTLSVATIADATATSVHGAALADAGFAETVLLQVASGGDASSVTLTNSGTLSILASANASGKAAGEGMAIISGWAILQSASADGAKTSTAAVTLTNSGTLTILASATATIVGDGGRA